ncbi:hypothetical protein GCM10010398_11100 [Streptomyces fimbriatus]
MLGDGGANTAGLPDDVTDWCCAPSLLRHRVPGHGPYGPGGRASGPARAPHGAVRRRFGTSGPCRRSRAGTKPTVHAPLGARYEGVAPAAVTRSGPCRLVRPRGLRHMPLSGRAGGVEAHETGTPS